MGKTNAKKYEPKFLGRAVSGPATEVDLIPWTGGTIAITLSCSEFTTICPITGQPDFGKLEIVYVPGKHLIETKSLKLYLQGFRERKGFNEQIVADLADDLYRQVKPRRLYITGTYNVRGGISVTCTAERNTKSR